jgi:hypothetical protein
MMMIGTREVIHRLSGNWAAGLLDPIVAEPAALNSATPARRHEPRVAERNMCAYELCESIDDESVVIQEGEVFTVNRSAHGILLLMGHHPRAQQLIELDIPESRWRHSKNLYEVQWTKLVPVESQGDLFLVGCRLTFGPTRYWTF